MLHAFNTIVGVDFGAPQRARNQRRKIIAIEARAIDWRRYRVDAERAERRERSAYFAATEESAMSVTSAGT
ncbi:hypothetical protein [Nannocystis radixulma]|uniref:Transposase n=1 Tax=Nannocystis radixulma TaxID=2995305 RepID=A0ABT5BQ69_9BACT|nr:hypothetical protein [Nannocystis radixulma]MDC0675704.1 hypothetical protein [Nannocystis radixulma]